MPQNFLGITLQRTGSYISTIVHFFQHLCWLDSVNVILMRQLVAWPKQSWKGVKVQIVLVLCCFGTHHSEHQAHQWQMPQKIFCSWLLLQLQIPVDWGCSYSWKEKHKKISYLLKIKETIKTSYSVVYKNKLPVRFLESCCSEIWTTIGMGDTLFQIIGGVLYCTSIICTDVFFFYFKVNAELNMIGKSNISAQSF